MKSLVERIPGGEDGQLGDQFGGPAQAQRGLVGLQEAFGLPLYPALIGVLLVAGGFVVRRLRS